MSVGSFSTILETFWFSSQRVGGQSGENTISGKKSSGPPQNLWSIKLSEMNHFHSMYHPLAITHALQKKCPPRCRLSISQCRASFTSHPPCLCIHTVLHWEQGKGHYVSEKVTLLLMASPGAAGTSQDLRNSQFLLLDTYLLSHCFIQVYSRRWPYCKSCFPTALLKLVCLDLCSFC